MSIHLLKEDSSSLGRCQYVFQKRYREGGEVVFTQTLTGLSCTVAPPLRADISLDMPAFYGRVPCVVLLERFEDHQPKHEGALFIGEPLVVGGDVVLHEDHNWLEFIRETIRGVHMLKPNVLIDGMCFFHRDVTIQHDPLISGSMRFFYKHLDQLLTDVLPPKGGTDIKPFELAGCVVTPFETYTPCGLTILHGEQETSRRRCIYTR